MSHKCRNVAAGGYHSLAVTGINTCSVPNVATSVPLSVSRVPMCIALTPGCSTLLAVWQAIKSCKCKSYFDSKLGSSKCLYHRGWWVVCVGLESAWTMWCRRIDRQTQVRSRHWRFQGVWFKLDLECVPATSGQRTSCCLKSLLWLESCASCDRWVILRYWELDLPELVDYHVLCTSFLEFKYVSWCLLCSSQAKCVCLGKVRLWTIGPWK